MSTVRRAAETKAVGAKARSAAATPRRNEGGQKDKREAGAPAYLQPKLTVGQPQDPAEREADRVAGEVRRSRPPARPAGGQRGSLEPAITPPAQDSVLSPKLRRPATADARAPIPPGSELPAAAEERICARRGQGAPLEENLRARLEAKLGRDLARVRIHTDAESDGLCARMHARAFTVGEDIYFAAGNYAPESDAGLELLAHELTHVGQQAAAGGPGSAAPKLQCDWWDDLFGGGSTPADPLAACRSELADAERWAGAGPYPAAPQAIIGGGGRGGFDAQYRPDGATGDGVLDIRQGVAVQFKDTLVMSGGTVAPHPDLPATPQFTALAARVNAIGNPARRAAALAAYQWTSAERTPWIDSLRSLIETTWSGRHSFFLNMPRWDWLGAEVRVSLDIGPRAKGAGDHMATEAYKTPPGETLPSFGTVAEVGHGSGGSANDQTMRLASTNISANAFDLLRESVLFGDNSDVLTAAATGILDAFIARFDGATAHAAHQEVRVDIVGHASASGAEAHNKDLSRRRAEAVRDYLVSHGFANTASRVILEPRGETEADPSQPRRGSDRRVDLVVDGGERLIAAGHEWGHAFGLGDEYLTGTAGIGDPAAHDAMARAMGDAGGNPLPGAIREHNAGIMSFGNEVRPRHYATFHHALATVTAQSPWSLGLHKAKWQVAMECGVPSPAGDWLGPRQPAPASPAQDPAAAAPGDHGSASA